VTTAGKYKIAVTAILWFKSQFFDKVCELDLEGIVAKRKTAAYRATDKPSPYYIKIKNPSYSQAEGREELFNPKPDRIADESIIDQIERHIL